MLSLVVGLVTLGITHFWLLFQVIRTGMKAPTKPDFRDAVAVLGKQLQQGEISADFRLRLDRALTLYQVWDRPEVLVIGGGASGEISEANAGANYLIQAGVESAAIALEELSVNTLENFRHAHPWFEDHSQVVVISNRYHLFRVLTMAQGLGLEITPCAAEDKCRPWHRVSNLLLEAVFLHWYWSGRIFVFLIKNKRMLKKIS